MRSARSTYNNTGSELADKDIVESYSGADKGEHPYGVVSVRGSRWQVLFGSPASVVNQHAIHNRLVLERAVSRLEIY